ncbi:MAG TPA: hypothetical protein VLS89_17470, partial [Candidatus Nanopelagicales bacterium]|nr:hypothetical protein [Candidatus Nanopelagicales bacterium]
NFGEAVTTGVDVQAKVKAGEFLGVEVGYAYLWTRDLTNERPLPSRPPHTVQAAIRADLPLRLELVARYRAVTDAFLDEGLRTTPFQTLDLRLARALWEQAQAYVGVRNVLGVQRDPLRLGEDQRPIEGRIIYLGVIAELPWEDDEP